MTALELEPAVRTATPAQAQKLIAPLVLAFANDPAVRWMYPDAHQYRTFFPAFVRAFAGKAFALGTAQSIGDFHGIALWLPPGVQPDEEELGALLQETVAPALLEEVLALLGEMSAKHPKTPHWYLPLLGVDPRHQGLGLGSALLAQMLAVCDEQGLPAYLESTNEKSVPFYKRHGFEVRAVIQAGSSPRLIAMQRNAR
jgi:ribosomal protein S18 acetylase RimI-like enzyme